MSARPVYLRLGEYMPALRERITDLSKGHNPAPWAFADEDKIAGDDITPKGRLGAISQRANKTFSRAMLTGSLRGWFTDGRERWQIPGWAWADQAGDKNRLVSGNDFLHPLLPPEIRRWAGREVLIGQAEFEGWLDSSELEDQTGFPNLPPAYDEAQRPAYVTKQDPPNTPNVSLSCAISWLAFGISLDATTLFYALSADAFGPDRAAVDYKLGEATDRLVTAGTGGLPFWGKLVMNDRAEGAPMTERIDAVRLEDFRQFDVLNDGFRYGTGLLLDRAQHNMIALNLAFPSPGHKYIDVKVDRAGLMARFASMSVAETPQPVGIDAPKRRPPGPAADPDWPEAIAAVTDACIAAGYTRQLKRGEETAIGTMLLNKMAERDKHFSPDIAAKHAARVIEALPDN